MKHWGLAVASTAMLAGAAGFAQQESTNRVAQETDWSVFVEENPAQCWSVSTPTESVATEDGRTVAVNRGEILFFVSYWPEQSRMGEVSFASGYPFADGSVVDVRIGSQSFQLFTDGESAWAASSDADAEIIAAMRRGAEAVVTGLSRRGRQTVDTFSLIGFTAATEEAETRCSE